MARSKKDESFGYIIKYKKKVILGDSIVQEINIKEDKDLLEQLRILMNNGYIIISVKNNTYSKVQKLKIYDSIKE